MLLEEQKTPRNKFRGVCQVVFCVWSEIFQPERAAPCAHLLGHFN